MQRVHIDSRLGERLVSKLRPADVEVLASAMLASGLKQKSVRNVLVFLNGVLEHAIERGWTTDNPVRRAARPKRRRTGDINPDLQFLTMAELDAVLREIPIKSSGAHRRQRGVDAPARRRHHRPTCSARSCG